MERAVLRLVNTALPAHVRRLRVEGGQELADELAVDVVHAERVEAVLRIVAHGGRRRKGHPRLVRREEGERASGRECLRIAVGIDRCPVYRTFARREIIHNDVVHVYFRRRLGHGGAIRLAVEPPRIAGEQECGHCKGRGGGAPRAVKALRAIQRLEPHGHLEAVGAFRHVVREYPLHAGGVQPVERHIPRRHFTQRRHRARRARKSQNTDKFSHCFSSYFTWQGFFDETTKMRRHRRCRPTVFCRFLFQ